MLVSSRRTHVSNLQATLNLNILVALQTIKEKEPESVNLFDDSAYLFSQHDPFYISLFQEIEYDDG